MRNDKRLFLQSSEILQKAVELGASSYNLACVYALIGDKTNALKYLQVSIEKRQVATKYVKGDPDWNNYLQDPDFIKLLKKFEK